ncbi:uncharacterized protein LOC105233919 [Bactrocera dorsalis]|uniref:Uncharacterized protein LOC105233919 n=1 Tax=Bactrocera dorsalis TaxID=27457 RepID=A0ABM3JSK9_BACDO|nr:uncharacterized protein LOC105233919 [Bactrocera dorsalis]
MAKSKSCVFLALLCAAALLGSVTAEEQISAADAIIEARNDEVAPELLQPEADKVLSVPLPAKSELSENPAIVPVEVEEKTDEEQGKPVGEGEVAEAESAVIGAEDSKTENLELAMNAEILQHPEMVR